MQLTLEDAIDPLPDYVYVEEVLPLIQLAHKKFLADTTDMAINSAHGLAFHRGLGNPTASSSITPITKYLTEESIEYYSQIAYAKPNIAIVANGADHAEVSKWVGEFFGDLEAAAPDNDPKSGEEETKFFGGEERIAHDGGNAFVIGFPGSASATSKGYRPEIAVLASLFGGESSIKWSSGFSLFAKAAAPGSRIKTKSAIYSDAGLLFTTITGDAMSVRQSAGEVVKIIHEIASGKIDKEAIQKAKAAAKFKELEYGEDLKAGLELTGAGLIHGNQPYQIDEVAKKIDAVSEEQLKSVCLAFPAVVMLRPLIYCPRPPRNYSSSRLSFPLLEISSFFLMLKNSVSKCKYVTEVVGFGLRWGKFVVGCGRVPLLCDWVFR